MQIYFKCNFVLYKNSPFINNKLFIKILSENSVFFKKTDLQVWKQSKNKGCKKRYHKKSIKKVSYESFSSIYKYTIALFRNLALALVLAL